MPHRQSGRTGIINRPLGLSAQYLQHFKAVNGSALATSVKTPPLIAVIACWISMKGSCGNAALPARHRRYKLALGHLTRITTKALQGCVTGFYVSASKSNAHCRNCLLDLDKVMRLMPHRRPERAGVINGSWGSHAPKYHHNHFKGLLTPLGGNIGQESTIAVIACWISMGSCGHAAPPARRAGIATILVSRPENITTTLFKAV
jgi:hypothetical protein